MGCCGGRAKRRVPAARRAPAAPAVPMVKDASSGLVLLVYYGARKGDFQLAGGVTRERYHVPGQGQVVRILRTGQQGVMPADVRWFRSVNSGKDYRPIEAPKPVQPAPKLATPPPEPQPAPEPGPIAPQAVEDSEAWTPTAMEAEPLPIPDIQALTVAEIRELDVSPDLASALYGQEQAGKQRKTVLTWLEDRM